MHIMDKIYEIVDNPLDDSEVVEKMIKASFRSPIVYSSIVESNSKEKPFVLIKDKEYKEKFFLLRFNLWKDCFVNKDFENDPTEYKYNNYKSIKSFLSSIPDVKSYQEYKDTIPKDVKKLFNKTMIKNRYWTHIFSNTLCINDNKVGNVEHRLYINVDKCDCEKLAYHFLIKCQMFNIPYSFKYTNFLQRDDGFVIYTNNKYIEAHIRILHDIKNELDIKFYKPPFLTGVINGFIGYGSEPEEFLESFHSKRKKIIEEMKSIVIDYINNNSNNENYSQKHNMNVLYNLVFKRLNYNVITNPEMNFIIEDLCRDTKFLSYFLEQLQIKLDENNIDSNICFDTCRLGPFYSDKKPHAHTLKYEIEKYNN